VNLNFKGVDDISDIEAGYRMVEDFMKWEREKGPRETGSRGLIIFSTPRSTYAVWRNPKSWTIRKCGARNEIN
jgi:hypothetical protein